MGELDFKSETLGFLSKALKRASKLEPTQQMGDQSVVQGSLLEGLALKSNGQY